MLLDPGEEGLVLCSGRKLATPIVTQKVASVPKELGALAKEIPDSAISSIWRLLSA